MKKVLLVILLSPLVLMAQKNYQQSMDDYMKAQVNIKEFNGTVMLMKKGKVIYEKAFGMADREWNVSNTIDTKYRIGSVTKQFTAACIMQLAEQGKLSVDDKLAKYIADYPKGDSVTIHMLLNHSSGIKNYTDMPAFWPKVTLSITIDSMIAVFKNAPYDFSPGTQWNYSNSGYFLLGYIIEKASGTSYSDYLLKNIIQKIGLKNTMPDRPDSILQYRAKGYGKEDKGWLNAMYLSMDWPYSAGAMVSTVHDLQQWMQALMENKIVSAASVSKMTTAYKNSYGYGLGIDSLGTHKRIGHSGAIPGFVSYISYYPQDDIYSIALSNNSVSASPVANGLAGILLDMPVFVPYIPKAITLTHEQLDKFTGSYVSPNSTIDIVRRGNALYRQRSGASSIELKPESDTRLFYADGSDRFIEFEFDKDNVLVKATLLNGNEKTALKKK